jgi:hypothetical protein
MWSYMTAHTVLTPEKVAKILHVAPRTLQEWRIKKQGPNWIKMGGGVRYLEEDINIFIENLRNDE